VRSSAALGGSKSLSWLHSRGSKSRSNAAAASPEYGGSSSSLAVPSPTLQQTARGWLANYDGRLSQDFWSRQAAPTRAQASHVGPGGAGRSSSECERLPPIASNSARRENFKKDHYSTELDRIVKENGGAKPVRMLGRSVTLEQLEKEVISVSDIGSEIDKLLHSAHDQHKNFRPQKIEYEKLEKQEEREREDVRKVEAAVRRVRKKTDQPRSAKWRVEERINREREMWKDTGEPPPSTLDLPMTQFAVRCDHGKEEHTLVDVAAVQAKCRSLSHGCSAKSLLEKQRVQDEEATAKKSSVNYDICQADLEAYAALSWEDRMELAQRRKLQGHISTVFNKMGAMRSKYPKEVPDSIVNHLYSMSEGDYSWHGGD